MAGVKGRSGGARKGAGRRPRNSSEFLISAFEKPFEKSAKSNRKKGARGGARPGSGRKLFVPTAEDRGRVKACKGFGLTDDQIAQLVLHPTTGLPISAETLRERFKVELERGHPEAIAAVANSLFMNATRNNNVSAQIFFLKTRARWTENVNVTVRRPEDMSDDELDAALVAYAGNEPAGEGATPSGASIQRATTGESPTRH